jgi:hypothetical protein
MPDAAEAARSRVILAQLETPIDAIEALFSGAPAEAGCLRVLNAAPAILEARRPGLPNARARRLRCRRGRRSRRRLMLSLKP